ncbi:MAG: hypothetical protein R3F59_08745 [Myxococcota bacterium]
MQRSFCSQRYRSPLAQLAQLAQLALLAPPALLTPATPRWARSGVPADCA